MHVVASTCMGLAEAAQPKRRQSATADRLNCQSPLLFDVQF